METLSYLLILNNAGLPFYSRSFQFEDIKSCQNFGNRVSTKQQAATDHLMASYFSALKMYSNVVLDTELNVFGLGFSNFKIEGVVREDIYFIGIFEADLDEWDSNSAYRQLEEISEIFLDKFPDRDIGVFQSNKYEHFTDVLLPIIGIEIDDVAERDCIVQCSDNYKGCIPHQFFFRHIQENLDVYSPSFKVVDYLEPKNIE